MEEPQPAPIDRNALNAAHAQIIASLCSSLPSLLAMSRDNGTKPADEAFALIKASHQIVMNNSYPSA